MFFQSSSPVFDKYFYWLKIIFKFSFVQIVVQLMGMVSGFLLIRYLDKKEYGYYTIAFSIQSTMTLLAANGLGVGMLSIGGKFWQDTYKLGRIFNAAFVIKKRITSLILLILSPILLWLLNSSGAPLYYSIVATIIIIAGANFDIKTSIESVILQLHSKIAQVQTLDFYSSLAKAILVCIGCFTYINGIIALAITSIIMAFKQFFVHRFISRYVDKNALPAKEDIDAHMVIIKQLAPNAIFFSIQGQISVWLIGIFGNVQGIAEIGALGRISIIYTIVGSILSNIILPRIARNQEFKGLRLQYFQVIGMFLIFNTILVAFSAAFPEALLWVLGNNYSHLHKELMLIVANAVCSNLIGTLWAINASKAWINNSWLYIPGTLATQVILLLFLDVSKTDEVIVFSIFSQIPSFLLNIYLARKGFLQLRNSELIIAKKVI